MQDDIAFEPLWQSGPYARRFAQLVAEFNLRPDRYVDPSWPAGLWPAPWNDMSRFGERGQIVLAKALANVVGLSAEGSGALPADYDFSSRDKRLALLPREALAELAQLCGLCLHKAWLAGSDVTRGVDKSLTLAFGVDTLQFVHTRTPPFDAVSETLETMRRYPKLVVQKIGARGARLLLDFIAPAGASVFARTRLKLPRIADVQPAYRLNDAQRSELAELLFLCLIPERLSGWDWLF
ncbi:SctK family type III secretion system sorting platform protein [Trinickia fusca]|uniref:BcscK n=1 Tax=Trinickia fusca TaxID=2419777 RepID=A0A494XJ32_9BURK|nr:SctK family type III secretion system sorting platform protein [Trinickia fusca]RKP50598.1 bcscK [Trinickia fusca]